MHNHGISQSALTTFRDCPFAYKCYRERKDAVFFDRDIMDTGKFVHDAIDRYYKNHYLTKGTADDILLLSYGHLKKTWDTTFTPEYLKKAFVSLQNHASWEAKNILNGIGTKPLTEVVIGEQGFYGIIDYIDLNNVKMIDWKTGSYPSLSYNYRIQAVIYKILAEAKFGIKLEKFYFFFLPVNEWRVVNFNSDFQLKVAEEVMKLKGEIDKSIEMGEFLKKPRTENMCRNCSYKLYCKIGGEQVDE